MNDRVYRIAPMYRRCCWLVLAAAPIVIAAHLLVTAPVKGIPIEEAIIASIILGGIACLVALPPLSWRLTVDDSGWRRRYLGVETLWPWSDFEAGEITAAGVYLRHRKSAWWNLWASIFIGFLSEEDIVSAAATIDHFFPAEQPPEPPGELTVRLLGERFQLDDKGVHIENRRGGSSYSWSEVIAVDVMRDNRKSTSFSMLEIVLPERVVTLRNANGKTAGFFNNPPPPVIAEFLRRRISDSRYAISVTGNRLANRALAERRSREANRDSNQLTWIAHGTSALIAGLALWDARVLVYLPLISAFVWMAHRYRAHAKAWRDLLKDDAWQTTPPPRLKM